MLIPMGQTALIAARMLILHLGAMGRRREIWMGVPVVAQDAKLEQRIGTLNASQQTCCGCIGKR